MGTPKIGHLPHIFLLCVVINWMSLPCVAGELTHTMITGKHFILEPIGSVQKKADRTTLVIEKKFAAALRGLDGFSHVWVFWWFDRNDNPEKRSVLQVHPRGNPENPLTGVFACRSPARPNLIAFTLCRILAVNGNELEVEEIDAFADTPILDLKPYIPGIDSAAEALVPDWIRRKKEQAPGSLPPGKQTGK